MQILEHGREHERTLLFFPCTAEPVWVFEQTVALLSRTLHVFQVVYDGHQPEYPGDFCRYAEEFLSGQAEAEGR